MSGFSHPNFGNEVKLKVRGREVQLIFVANTSMQANSLAAYLLEQLKSGAINLTLMGKPTSVTESEEGG